MFYLPIGLAGYSVGPGISCGARKLARTPRVTKNKKSLRITKYKLKYSALHNRGTFIGHHLKALFNSDLFIYFFLNSILISSFFLCFFFSNLCFFLSISISSFNIWFIGD
jgi:restriction endonuclease S subunit